jgi:hypothetical protein
MTAIIWTLMTPGANTRYVDMYTILICSPVH